MTLERWAVSGHDNWLRRLESRAETLGEIVTDGYTRAAEFGCALWTLLLQILQVLHRTEGVGCGPADQ